jgi:hypothetical protein
MDLFNEELELTGVCESLQSQIYQYHTIEQIIEALNRRFLTLIANNKMRTVLFAEVCLNTSNFDKFRDIFNDAKSPDSEKFLEEFSDWYGEDYSKEISILREDMKRWRKRGL